MGARDDGYSFILMAILGDTALEFRLTRGEIGDRSVVQDNFKFFVGLPVIGYLIDPMIKTDRGIHKLLPDLAPDALSPLPPDLPLPALPANGLDWTKDARIVQPWGKTQWDAIVRAADRAPWLAREFGFNTMIILPPQAHNAISPEAEQITERQFERALEICRANGFRWKLCRLHLIRAAFRKGLEDYCPRK